MRILSLSHVKMSKQQEGDSIHLLEMALSLQRHGNDLLIICQGGKHISHLIPTKQVPGFRMRYLTSFFLDLIFIPYLIFYIKKFNPDIVYYRDVSIVGILSWLLRVPSVAEANGIYADIAKIERPLFFRIAGKFLQFRERIQYFRATRIICVTEGIKNELVMNYGVKNEVCKVIHNGVNTRLFRPSNKKVCRKKLDIADDYFYIGFVGSFKAWQGLETLIEAMRIVKIKGNDRIKCLFIGDGYLMNHLREMVSRYALNNELIFKGRIAYKNIPGVINSFDICVAPFKKERNQKIGLSPLKLYEYLACARPVIASRVEGVSEVIEKGNCGYLFDPDDVESLSSSIIESYQERDKLPELGKNGRRFIKDQFSWEKVAESVQSVLLEAINKNKG
jgi:glycosyltransferase involved in cell wall biosynthesis